MKRYGLIVIALFATIIFCRSASALQFTMNSFKVTENAPRLSWTPIQTTPLNLDLEAGESTTYNLFQVEVPSGLVSVGTPQWYWDISAEFNMTGAGLFQSEVDQSVGQILSNSRRIRWNQDAEFQFGDTGLFTIGLNEVGLNPTNIVKATFSYVSAPAPVPEPATILLLGTGLAGIVRVSKRKEH